MSSSATDRKKLALDMRVTARHLFEYALSEASIDRAFQRHVDCDKGVLRVCEDLYNLDSYNRVLVIAVGKAAHAMVNSLEMQAGDRFQGIVASSIDPISQIRGFRYFRGGHPMPTQESVRAAEAMLKSLSAQNAASLVIFLLSGGGSSIAEKPVDQDISLADLIATYQVLVHSGAPIAEINTIRKHLSAIKGEGWPWPHPRRNRSRCWFLTFLTIRPTLSPPARPCLTPPAWQIVTPSPRNTACSNAFRIPCESCFNTTLLRKLPSQMIWPSIELAGGHFCRTPRSWKRRRWRLNVTVFPWK